ncbi:fasciclin domain-containing protein [Methanoculleus oceani]|uniref:Fasciclin n=1 Tax=Methanoculleus oceani TaxID=2184756 RepID=A0ABD4TB11_9EURY|nr:fasciclin domain-containing protein [Methanoculleus sp. CWC-02]MCM2464918.1 fasciclin [Methanoculleus sp. CWC-02]
MRRNPTILGLVAALAIGLVALPVLAATADVDIRDGAYLPPSLTVEGNTTVTWTNYDEVSHTVTSTGGLFDSGPIEQNETFDYTFADTGTYPYGCTLNASTQRTPMQGVVIVVPEGMMVDGEETATPTEEPENATLADLIAGNENLTSFADAVGGAGLTETVLATGGPYTVFAPDDAAFEALGNETRAGLSNDTETLDTLLMHHVVGGNYTLEDLMAEVNATGNETVLETLTGDNLSVVAADGTLTVGNATIVASDITADNGVVHIIDTVLVPPGLVLPENVTPAGNETADANVTITSPEEGASIAAGNVTVSVNVTNFTLVEPTGQANAPGEGHLHYYLDAPVPTNASAPAIPETGGYVVSANTSYTWENVTAGEHNLSVQLVNNDHTPLIPLMFETVNATVDGNATPEATPEERVIP